MFQFLFKEIPFLIACCFSGGVSFSMVSSECLNMQRERIGSKMNTDHELEIEQDKRESLRPTLAGYKHADLSPLLLCV